LRWAMALVLSPRTSTPADWMISNFLYTYTGSTVTTRVNTSSNLMARNWLNIQCRKN
jgi:hypothetical protein